MKSLMFILIFGSLMANAQTDFTKKVQCLGSTIVKEWDSFSNLTFILNSRFEPAQKSVLNVHEVLIEIVGPPWYSKYQTSHPYFEPNCQKEGSIVTCGDAVIGSDALTFQIKMDLNSMTATGIYKEINNPVENSTTTFEFSSENPLKCYELGLLR